MVRPAILAACATIIASCLLLGDGALDPGGSQGGAAGDPVMVGPGGAVNGGGAGGGANGGEGGSGATTSTGGGDCEQSTAADYVVYQPSGAINIDGDCEESVWQSTPLVPWTVTSNNNTDNAYVDCRLIWRDGKGVVDDVLYGCCEVADDDIEGGEPDDGVLATDDSIELFFADHVGPDWGPFTQKFFGSAAGAHADIEWSTGMADPAYDADVTLAATVLGTLNTTSSSNNDDTSYTVEWRMNLGFKGTAESVYNCFFSMWDDDNNSQMSWKAMGRTGMINDPATFHECKLSCKNQP